MNATTHFSENLLERYSMGKLSDQESAPLEEHLLVCPACQHELEKIDDFLGAAQAALSSLNSQPLRRRVPGFPRMVWAVGLAAALVLFLTPYFGNPTVAVTLSTERGAASFPRVHAGGRLRLKIDVSQVPQPDGYQMEIVDSGGQPVWHAAVEAFHDEIVATVGKHLAPGRYWIRLYDTGSPWKLLREYGVDVD